MDNQQVATNEIALDTTAGAHHVEGSEAIATAAMGSEDTGEETPVPSSSQHTESSNQRSMTPLDGQDQSESDDDGAHMSRKAIRKIQKDINSRTYVFQGNCAHCRNVREKDRLRLEMGDVETAMQQRQTELAVETDAVSKARVRKAIAKDGVELRMMRERIAELEEEERMWL